MALGDQVQKYMWAIVDLEAFGPGVWDVVQSCHDAKQTGGVLLITPGELKTLADSIYQTVNALMFGVPLEKTASLGNWEALLAFPESAAEVMLWIVDGVRHIVSSTQLGHINLLRSTFQDVREEDSPDFV